MFNFYNGILYTVDNDGKQTEINQCTDRELNFSQNEIVGDIKVHTTKTKGHGTIKNVQVDNDFLLWIQIEHSRMLRHMYEFMESVKLMRKERLLWDVIHNDLFIH